MTETRNEAPERLLVFEANLTSHDVETIRKALVAERRATVEQVRVAILDALAEPQVGMMPGLAAHDECWTAARAILDEEAAR